MVHSILTNIWSSLMSNFGGRHPPSSADNIGSYKTLLWTSLLSGLIIWMFYRAELTSELADQNTVHPFHDLESLSESGYKYVIWAWSSALIIILY